MNEYIENELFPFYVLGALTDEEQAEVEAYITADPEAKARLAGLMAAADALPLAVEPISPASKVKTQLMARIRADASIRADVHAPSTAAPSPQPAPPSPASTWERLREWYGRWQQSPALPALAGACLLLAIVVAGWALAQNRQMAAMQARLQSLEGHVATLEAERLHYQDLAAAVGDEITTLRAENEALRQQLENQNEMLAAYQQPGTLTVAIGDASGSHPDAVGTLTIDPATATAVFVAHHLDQLNESQVYQLWLIRGDMPVSAGIFHVDETGQGVLPVATAVPGSFDAIGVTVEPAGGSQVPTLDQLILLGTVSS